MIRIKLILVCDRCNIARNPVTKYDVLFRRDIEEVRKKAKTWSRFRLSASRSKEDFCGRCTRAIRYELAARAKAKKRSPHK